ncbi:hypothetical protein DFQ30_009111 [Apophysomyces sp. BC1015]|nr:hypothetical protein DFQ30_009111 [Apophysomyces sp. BC1015]
MGSKTPVTEGDLFRQPLREQINLKHPLVQLVDLIDWDRLSMAMSVSFVSHRGRPASSPRLIAGLLYLQHALDLSDEDVVWQWLENPYWVERVHYDEGLASHIAPEPCVGIREDIGEASAGECAGQPWSHEMVYIPDADALQYAEGNMSRHDIASACRSGVVVEPGMHASALRGNREISRPACRDEAREQRRKTGYGVGGAKGGDRGEREPDSRAPGAEPGKRVTGTGTRTAVGETA